MTYRDHTITQEHGGIYAMLGYRDGYSIRGPLCNGASPTLRGAKTMVDRGILEEACKAATGHQPRIIRDGNQRCANCGSYLGSVPKPGDGATRAFYRVAANGHRYGWTTSKDRLGHWYAIDENDSARKRENRRRLIRCATRTKAKAKATAWWLKAKQATE